MVGFGSSLRMARRPGWEEAYLDYEALKLLLTQIEAIYEEEAHLQQQQQRQEGRDLDMMFLEPQHGTSVSGFTAVRHSVRADHPPPGSKSHAAQQDYRDELFIESDSDKAFESLMKYDYYSAEEEASDLEQQQQHQLELAEQQQAAAAQQATLMMMQQQNYNHHNNNNGSSPTSSSYPIHSNSASIGSKPTPNTIFGGSVTDIFGGGGGTNNVTQTPRYHHLSDYGALSHHHTEGFAAADKNYLYEEEDSQDGNLGNNCVPAAWCEAQSNRKKKKNKNKLRPATTTAGAAAGAAAAPQTRLPFRSSSSTNNHNQFLSPNRASGHDHLSLSSGDFFVPLQQPTVTDAFILDSSESQTMFEDDAPVTTAKTTTSDATATLGEGTTTSTTSLLTSFSTTSQQQQQQQLKSSSSGSNLNNNNSILQKPFRRTSSSEKTSLLSAPPATPGTGLFSFASQTGGGKGPITPPPGGGDDYPNSYNHHHHHHRAGSAANNTLQMPSIASLKSNQHHHATTSSKGPYHLQNKAKLAKKLEEERKKERRKRRQKRRKRAEERKALERKVPRHIRIAHTKARDITERFLGLLRAECEKVMLFAQSRLGELADTAGSLRFPSMEDPQQPQSSSSVSSHYHHGGPTTTTIISSQPSVVDPPLSPHTQGSFDYPLSEGGMHSSASSTSDDGGGGLFYWSDSSSDSVRSRESGSPNLDRNLSAFRDIQHQHRHHHHSTKSSSQQHQHQHPHRRTARKHDGFTSTKRHLDHFEKLRRNRPIFCRSGNVMGEDLLLLSAVDEADGFTAVGVELMHVLRFICVNLIAVRKICRKHDRLLMNRMLGGYYHHLKMVAAAEANSKWYGRARGPQSAQRLNPNQDEHVQNAQTLGGLLARESADVFEPHHPAVIGQINNYKLVGLYDTNLQQLANSRTVQVISSCLVLALSEYEVSRTRANALATLNSTGSGLPPPRRGSGSRAVLRHKQQQDQMSVLTGADSHVAATMFSLDEADEHAVGMDSDDENGPPSTASSISLTRLRFTVTSIIALREAARRKKDMYSTYLSRSMLAFTGRAVVGEGLDGCSRETLDFLVSYNPDAALLLDPAALNDGLKQGMWSKRSMCSVMASSLAVATTPVDLPYAVSSKAFQKKERVVIAAINVLPKVKFLEVPDLFRSQRNKKSRNHVTMLENDPFRSIVRLNRSSHLLYTMNYYVVHPTTITFVTAVGSPGAHSALVIGAPSLAALMSALLHCYVLSGDRNEASNVCSLRWLFLLASALGFVGNVVHVYGIWMQSISFAVLGRFIMGFSCSEILHRNIVANLLPHNRVVVETAILVQMQVFGLLMGLLLGTLAEFLPYHVQGWGVRSLSSAGWVMAFLWFMYLGFVCAFFKVENDGEAKERLEANNSAEVEQLLAKYQPTAAAHPDSDSSASGQGGKGTTSSARRSPSIKLTYGATEESEGIVDQMAKDAAEVTISNNKKDKKSHHKKSRKRRLRTLKSFPSRLHQLLSYSVAVPLCLFILLFIKFAQEVLFSSCPMILNRYFRWGGGRAGIFLAGLTITILPLHFICGHISRKYEERSVIKKSLVVLLVGLLVMVNYGSVIKLAFQLKDLLTETEERQRETMYDWLLGIIQYFVGFGITFLGLTSLDSSTLSLLSKVSPPRIRSSSVALQLGTIVSFVSLVARVVADMQILMIGLSHRLINTDLVNSLILPLLVATWVIAHFVRKHFFFLM